jgi:hypothetical protein
VAASAGGAVAPSVAAVAGGGPTAAHSKKRFQLQRHKYGACYAPPGSGDPARAVSGGPVPGRGDVGRAGMAASHPHTFSVASQK